MAIVSNTVFAALSAIQKNSVTMLIQYDADELYIQVNPKDMDINQSASNSNIDIIGIGKATRKEDPGLITTKIKSFFPSLDSPFNIRGVSPEQSIKFIKDIWKAQYNADTLKIPKILTYGLDVNLNMYFVIDQFTYKYQHGTKDVDFTLSIKEYIPYGAKKTDYMFNGLAAARAPSVVSDEVPVINPDETNPTTESKTYVVKSGDTLWSIAKRCTGNGNNWQALYEANKSVISNPNVLKVGTILTLPLGWSSPGTSSGGTTSSTGKTKVKNTTKTISVQDTSNIPSAKEISSAIESFVNQKVLQKSENAGTQPSKQISREEVEVAEGLLVVTGPTGLGNAIIHGEKAVKQINENFENAFPSVAYDMKKEEMLRQARAGNWDKAIEIKERAEQLKLKATITEQITKK